MRWTSRLHATVSLATCGRCDIPTCRVSSCEPRVSVPTNIAEGHGRGTDRDFAHFLDISMGSLREVETLVILTESVGLAKRATSTDLLKQADEVGRVLYGLR